MVKYCFLLLLLNWERLQESKDQWHQDWFEQLCHNRCDQGTKTIKISNCPEFKLHLDILYLSFNLNLTEEYWLYCRVVIDEWTGSKKTCLKCLKELEPTAGRTLRYVYTVDTLYLDIPGTLQKCRDIRMST